MSKAMMTVTPPNFDPLRFCIPSPRVVDRHQMIAFAAYFLAERRGFAPGYEAEDWAAAEREIDLQLVKEGGHVT